MWLTKWGMYRVYSLVLTLILLSACSNLATQKTNNQHVLVASDEDSLRKELLKSIDIKEKQLWQADSDPATVDIVWIKSFSDQKLQEFVNTATKNNQSLQAQLSRVDASYAGVGITSAQRRPTLDARLQHQYRQSTISGDYGSTYSPSINVSWEIDLWSRLSKSNRSAVLNAERSQYDYAAAQSLLVANVARSWFNLNADKLRLELLQKRLASLEQSLAVTEEQFKSGRGKAMDVFLSRSDVASQKSARLDGQNQLEQSMRAFKRLLGRYPDIDLDFDAKLPDINAPVPSGLPSELLTRRPDILASQRAWQAAILDSEVADKARLPSFSLTAAYGASSDDLLGIDASDFAWNLINNLTVPLFQGGRLASQFKQSQLLAEARYKEYIVVVLNAFEEVETALGAEQFLAKRLDATIEATQAAESAYELAFEQYQSGLISYSNLLDFERRWFTAQLDGITLKNAKLQNRINLHLALGGQFSD